MQTLVQLEGGQHRPPGMILLGHGRAKHGRDAVTGRQGEGARIGLEHLLGQSHHRLEQAIPPLRAQPCRQGGRLGQGPTEDGHQLVFLLQGNSRRRKLGDLVGGWSSARGLWGNRQDGQRWWGGHHCYRSDKPIAYAAPGLNQPLALPAVAEGLAQLGNAGAERLVTDELVRPDVRQQLVFGHHTVVLGQEICQHLKHFRP